MTVGIVRLFIVPGVAKPDQQTTMMTLQCCLLEREAALSMTKYAAKDAHIVCQADTSDLDNTSRLRDAANNALLHITPFCLLVFSAEMARAGLIDEMMNDAIDSALDNEDMEAETDEEIEKVLLEVAGETLAALPAAKTRPVSIRVFLNLKSCLKVILVAAYVIYMRVVPAKSSSLNSRQHREM